MKLVWIGAGGALGSVARYLVELSFQRWLGSGFPAGTLAVNALGCFAIGLALVGLEARNVLDSTLRLAVVTGFLGGFTTYSSFNQQSLELWRTRGAAVACAYLIATLAGCLFLGLIGASAGRWLFGP
jgi:CrcB protein